MAANRKTRLIEFRIFEVRYTPFGCNDTRTVPIAATHIGNAEDIFLRDRGVRAYRERIESITKTGTRVNVQVEIA